MTLPWLRVDRTLNRHPKADLLDAALGERRTWTYVVELWMWVAEMRPGGDLAGITDTILAKRAGYEGDPSKFVTALIECGWMTVERQLHDWEEYQGARREKAARDAERKREMRHGQSADGARTARGQTADGARTARGQTADGARSDSGQTAVSQRRVAPAALRGAPRRSDGAGNGTERYGTERNETSEVLTDPRESAEPEVSKPPPEEVDRSRQNPNYPPPLPGKVVRPRLNGHGVGFMENPYGFPQTVEDLLQRHQDELSRAFPMLDGKTPRPSIETSVRAKWNWYLHERSKPNGGHANAMATLKLDLGRIAKDHVFSWEKEQNGGKPVFEIGPPADDPVRRRAREVWFRERGRGKDLAPFEDWFPGNAHRFDKPSSSVADLIPEMTEEDNRPVDFDAVFGKKRDDGSSDG